MAAGPDFTDPRCQPFFLEGGDTAILLIHGFTGSPGHMRPLGDALHAAGYTVQGIRLPGHAESIEAMRQSNWKQWLEAAESAYKELRARHPKVVVGGLSMGGLLALRLAELYPADALLAFAPALRFKKWTDNLAPAVQYVVPAIAWKVPPRQRDPGFEKAYDFGYPGLPVSKVPDMMRLIRLTRPELGRITCPALVVQSRYDESVHASVPETILRGIGSQVKEILWLEQSPHVCTLGADRSTVFKRCIDFLRENEINS